LTWQMKASAGRERKFRRSHIGQRPRWLNP
jgi:hypothetical protein